MALRTLLRVLVGVALLGACSVGLLKSLERDWTGEDAAYWVEQTTGIKPTRPAHCDVMSMGDSVSACRFDATPAQIAQLADRQKLSRSTHRGPSVCPMLKSGPWYPERFDGEQYTGHGQNEQFGVFNVLYDSATLTAYFCAASR